jgi:23S rRNA pseudouridine2605 synthase
LSNPGNISSNPAIPTGAQLAESRLKHWHQQGEALTTLENLRSWINAAGLVLFAPRPQIVSPAPSLVEALLGRPNASPTLEQIVEARGLMGRLVAEGLAVPLNLMGASGPGVQGGVGEAPDFVASTAVFSYVFTLRGDKAWKQPPATSGALKVSPLALATYEALTRSGPLTAFDLASELGKEVTEAAVLRALGELWMHLRVLPMPMADGRPAVWELVGTRFTKQIKAGANAGQPAALSALISLYLGQAVVASEEEIEGFLSPLAARSRIRDVVHALIGARQLDTLAVEGRTVLHVAGELPAFLAPASPEVEVHGDAEDAIEVEAGTALPDATEDGSARITKYVPRPRKIGTGYLAKASPSKFATKRPGSARSGDTKFGGDRAAKPSFKTAGRSSFKAGPKPDRERRPFGKAAGGFDKPWDEEKARRLAAAAKPSDVDAGVEALDFAASAAASERQTQPRAARDYKPRDGAAERSGGERRPSFGKKPSGSRSAFGGKPAFGDKPVFRGKPGSGARPSFGDARPPRRDFAARPDGDSGDARPARKTFSKPGTFGRKREGFTGRSASGDGRPPRRDFAPRSDRGDRPARESRPASRTPGTFSPRSASPRSVPPGSFAPRSFAPRSKPAAARENGQGDAMPRKPYPPRGAGFFSGKPRQADDRDARASGRVEGQAGKDRGAGTESGKRVYRKFDAPRERPARPTTSGGLARPGGGFAGKRPSGKPGGSSGKTGGSSKINPSSTFAKFADHKKPFGKRAPARKFKPKEGESA